MNLPPGFTPELVWTSTPPSVPGVYAKATDYGDGWRFEIEVIDLPDEWDDCGWTTRLLGPIPEPADPAGEKTGTEGEGDTK